MRPLPPKSWSEWTVTSALLTILLVGLTSCGATDSHTDDSPTRSATASPPTDTPSASDPPTATITQTDVADYATSDSDGDQVDVQISLGTPSLASQSGVTAVQDCASRVSSLSRSVVIPVEYDVTIESSMGDELHLGYGGTSGTVENGQFNESTTEFWAASYGNAGHVCANAQDYDSPVGSVVWNNAQPSVTEQFTGYLVADDVVTPDEPSAEDYADTVLFDSPQIRLGDQQLDDTPVSGTNVVNCGAFGADPAVGGQNTYVAVNPDIASAAGCSS